MLAPETVHASPQAVELVHQISDLCDKEQRVLEELCEIAEPLYDLLTEHLMDILMEQCSQCSVWDTATYYRFFSNIIPLLQTRLGRQIFKVFDFHSIIVKNSWISIIFFILSN